MGNFKTVSGDSSTGWVPMDDGGVRMKVETKETFASVPNYFASLSGAGNNINQAFGASTIQLPTKTSFQVRIRRIDGKKITKADIEGKWKIAWMAIGN